MHFGAGHCKYFIDFLTIVSPWKSVKKYWKYFIDFFNDCVTMGIRETDPRSPVAGGEQFPLFHAPAFTLVHYRGNLGPEDSVPGFAVFSKELSEPKSLSLVSLLFESLTAF